LQQTLSQNGTTVASYRWLADGTKCGVADNSGNGYEYVGSLIYRRTGSTLTLESTDFGGGRLVYNGNMVTATGTPGSYYEADKYYYITDHLGSVRVITDNSGAVQERNDYYPFGGKHANSAYAQLTVNKYKFNGKELQNTGNTGFLDYGARMYDDVIGRWSVVDPMAEKYYNNTPFNYCNGNPVRFFDPDGRNPIVGGIIGAVLDYGLQVTGNFISGEHSGLDAFTNVNLKSIGTSFVASASGVGLISKFKQLNSVLKMSRVATKIIETAGEAVIDASLSAGGQLVKTGDVDLSEVGIDVAAGFLGSKIGDQVKSANQLSPEGKLLSRQADHAERVAGNNPSASRSKKAEYAVKKAKNYGNNQAAATSVTVSNAVSTTYKKTQEELKNN
jgi:RHS repeat-associated protein